MNSIAARIVDLLVLKRIIDKESKDIYIYGFSMLIYTIISTIIIVLIGIISGNVLSVLILIILFYKNQSVGGGFHASTHLGCLICMIIGTIVYLAALSSSSSMYIDFLLMITAIGILWQYPLVLHPNKIYLVVHSDRLVQASIRLVILESILLLIVLIFQYTMIYRSIVYSLMLSAISRLVASKQRADLCFKRH